MTDVKAGARAEAFARRAEAFAAGQGQAAEILADFLVPHKGKVLSGYMPMRTEIDPVPPRPLRCGSGSGRRGAGWWRGRSRR